MGGKSWLNLGWRPQSRGPATPRPPPGRRLRRPPGTVSGRSRRDPTGRRGADCLPARQSTRFHTSRGYDGHHFHWINRVFNFSNIYYCLLMWFIFVINLHTFNHSVTLPQTLTLTHPRDCTNIHTLFAGAFWGILF